MQNIAVVFAIIFHTDGTRNVFLEKVEIAFFDVPKSISNELHQMLFYEKEKNINSKAFDMKTITM